MDQSADWEERCLLHVSPILKGTESNRIDNENHTPENKPLQHAPSRHSTTNYQPKEHDVQARDCDKGERYAGWPAGEGPHGVNRRQTSNHERDYSQQSE